jgi:protein SCO1/2
MDFLNLEWRWTIRRWGVRSTVVLLGFGMLLACSSSRKGDTTEGRQYPLRGKVLSIDKANLSMVVDGEAIPGLMEAMAMPYRVKNQGELDAVTVGDSIAATIVADKDSYVVQGVTVTQHPASPPPTTAPEAHIPQAGEAVPNFQLVNQNGRKISFDQYRGKTLLVTFIYTRCPFADYCPRVSGAFAEIHRALKKNAPLNGKTHLLTISFDPEHDTPKVLRAYGTGYLEQKPPNFAHWEFAAATAADLPEMARFFGVTYKEDGGVITHSLSTAVIGPDGKIFKWYHGSDWKVSDLLKDAADAAHTAG